MRWYTNLIAGAPYFVVGFADRNFTVPSIGTFVYLGVGALPECDGKHCFQDAQSFLAAPDEKEEPSYIALSEESLDMIADKEGLIAWLQSPQSTSNAGGAA